VALGDHGGTLNAKSQLPQIMTRRPWLHGQMT